VEEKLRIGVFVCNCGTNIGGFLDVPEVAEYSKTLPGVVYVKENLFTCSESGVNEIKEGIKNNNLNRVVVAACTPLTHEPTFRAACEEAGLNPYLFEFVNIREQCSWVHKNEREEATQKAKDLVRMGVARASKLEPKDRITAGVIPSALVIGGGISGLSAALSLANRGFKVKLIEKEKKLGGLVKSLYKIYPENINAEEYINQKINEVKKNKNINVFTSTEIKNVGGYIGNYKVKAENDKGNELNFDIGVIIVATGAKTLSPEGLFSYDGKKVIDMLQLEDKLKNDGISQYKNFVMILCAGSRNNERVYCSRICCMSAIKNALLIKEKNPESKIFILYRDLQAYGTTNEETLRRAKINGIRFVNYSLNKLPEVEDNTVRVYNEILGKELLIPADLIILATPLVAPEDNENLSKKLKVTLDENGFYLEAHIKLRPLDFSTNGIYVCGTAHWPASTEESTTQALGAAARSSIHLEKKYVMVEPIVSSVYYEDECRGCGLCASLCPSNAIEMVETPKGVKAKVIEVACRGCGICGASCYRHAIRMNHFSDEQIKAQIRAFLEE